MIYIPNDSLDPAYNQAFEECAFSMDTHEELLLVWRNRPSVICGRYQNFYQEVHLPTAAARDVQLVRRTTGGGSVYHDPGNVNYTLITDAEEIGYDAVLGRVIDALRAVGVPADRGQSSEIVIDGLKISGSAQRAHRGRLLHHGTLLFDANLTSLRRLANGHSACYQSRAIRSVPAPVTNIREHIRESHMEVEAFCERLVSAFAPDDVLRPDFAETAERLAGEKYRSWEWTFATSPKFTFQRHCDFFGEEMRIAYAAEHGEIGEIEIKCGGVDGAALEGALKGVRLELGELHRRLMDVLKDESQAKLMLNSLL